MVLKKTRSGRAEGTPTLFRPFSPMNSGFGIHPRLLLCPLFFRQEAGSRPRILSQYFLWISHVRCPSLPNGINSVKYLSGRRHGRFFVSLAFPHFLFEVCS